MLFCAAHEFLRLVNRFTAKGLSETSPLIELNKHIFRSQQLQKYLTYKSSSFFRVYCQFNPLMHKLGPRGPTHYIFGDCFYSKNARKLRFHVLLHFYARKHMIWSFYTKWTKFTRNCEFHSKYESRGNQTKLEQTSQFLVNSVHFR